MGIKNVNSGFTGSMYLKDQCQVRVVTLTNCITSSRLIWLSPGSSCVSVLPDNVNTLSTTVLQRRSTFWVELNCVYMYSYSVGWYCNVGTWWCWPQLFSPGSIAQDHASLPPGKQWPLTSVHCYSQSPRGTQKFHQRHEWHVVQQSRHCSPPRR